MPVATGFVRVDTIQEIPNVIDDPLESGVQASLLREHRIETEIVSLDQFALGGQATVAVLSLIHI